MAGIDFNGDECYLGALGALWPHACTHPFNRVPRRSIAVFVKNPLR